MSDRSDDEGARSLAGLSHPSPTTTPTEHPFSAAGDNRYRELEVVGTGGLGTVLRAHDQRLARDVALKRIGFGVDEQQAVAQFLREAQITARLDHPGIVPIHDAGLTADGRPFYTMRLIRGRSLAELAAAPMTIEARITGLGPLIAACHAVGYAHRHDVIHRDLKPANVMVGDLGETQVVDWGLAATGESDTDPTSHALGTPAYLAPEVARGGHHSAASDVWALGALLYEWLAGARRMPGDRAAVFAALRGELAPACWPAGCPGELAAIGDRAMALDPAARYPDAHALALDLEAFRDGRRVAAHRYSMRALARRFIAAWRWPLIALAMLIAGTIAALALTAHRTERERVRAVTAEQATREQLGRTDAALGAALATSAVSAFEAGNLARAEILAARALGHGESADARGVLAAVRAHSRPRRTAHEIPSCPRVIALGPKDALCASTELGAWTVSPARRRWTQPIELAGAFRVSDRWIVGWRDSGEVLVLDDVTGNIEARTSALARVVDASRSWEGTRVVLHDRHTVIAIASDGVPKVHERACGTRPVDAIATDERVTWLVCGGGELATSNGDALHSIVQTGFGTEIPPATALAVAETGMEVAIGSSAGDVALRDLRCTPPACDRATTLFNTSSSAIRELAFHGNDVLAVGDRGDAAVLRRGRPELARLPLRDFLVVEGGDVITGGSALVRWSLSSPRPARLVHARGVLRAAVSPRRHRIAAATDEGEVVLWDATTNLVLQTLRVGDVTALALDDRELWIARDADPGIQVFDATTGLERRLERAAPRTLALGHGNAWIAVGADRIYRAGSEQATSRTVAATVVPDGTVWLVGVDGAVSRVSGDRVTVEGTARGAHAIAVTADGAVRATATLHGIVVAGARSRTFAVGDSEVTAIALADDQRWLAAATSTGRVLIWDLAHGTLVARLHGHQQRATWLRFDGDRLWSAGLDRAVRWWELAALETAPTTLLADAIATWGDLE